MTFKSTHHSISILLLFILSICILVSCKKQEDWLDIKTNKSSVVPETLYDFQAMLDNTITFNNTYPTAGLMGTDNFTLTDKNFNAATELSRNLYIWNKDIWPNGSWPQWNNPYQIIEYCNVVLDGLSKITSVNSETNSVRGQALFHRAMAYYNLTQLFCKTYSESADTDLGLPIRLNSDVNELKERASLSTTYKQIISDLLESITYLPLSQPYLERPNKSAAFALLSKTYLNMGDYVKAEENATNCLNLNPKLINFNNNSQVSILSTYRFSSRGKNNPEILFYSQSLQFSEISPLTSVTGIVSNELYQMYDTNDLRKSIFFDTSNIDVKYRGSYAGNGSIFCGLATNEIYLIRAESNARLGNISQAITDLNLLLLNRYKTGTFNPKIALNTVDALKLILAERRKELPFTSQLRWEDLKRLNKEISYQSTITRFVNGISYSLLPNDKRFILPIPLQEIQTSNIKQNER